MVLSIALGAYRKKGLKDEKFELSTMMENGMQLWTVQYLLYYIKHIVIAIPSYRMIEWEFPRALLVNFSPVLKILHHLLARIGLENKSTGLVQK
jgi:hypothetical protein